MVKIRGLLFDKEIAKAAATSLPSRGLSLGVAPHDDRVVPWTMPRSQMPPNSRSSSAVALSKWIAESGPRPLSPRQVLRRPDIPVAAAVIGVDPPEHPRTAADILALNRPWNLALHAGLAEYPEYDGDGEQQPEPFDLEAVNRRLAALGSGRP